MARTKTAGRTATESASAPAKPTRAKHQPRSAPPATASLTEAAGVAPTPTPTKAPSGKLAILVDALAKPEGATIADLVAATGWLSHSVRGAISGSLKKKHGLTVTSEKVDGVRRYRLTSEA